MYEQWPLFVLYLWSAKYFPSFVIDLWTLTLWAKINSTLPTRTTALMPYTFPTFSFSRRSSSFIRTSPSGVLGVGRAQQPPVACLKHLQHRDHSISSLLCSHQRPMRIPPTNDHSRKPQTSLLVPSATTLPPGSLQIQSDLQWIFHALPRPVHTRFGHAACMLQWTALTYDNDQSSRPWGACSNLRCRSAGPQNLGVIWSPHHHRHRKPRASSWTRRHSKDSKSCSTLSSIIQRFTREEGAHLLKIFCECA